MNIQPLINAIRYKLRYGITVEWYNFWYMALRCHQKITPQVASIDETIRIIVEDQCSVSRFGDGEMLLTNPDKEIGFVGIRMGVPYILGRMDMSGFPSLYVLRSFLVVSSAVC